MEIKLNYADTSIDKATGGDEAASADKRKKLKGDEEDK